MPECGFRPVQFKVGALLVNSWAVNNSLHKVFEALKQAYHALTGLVCLKFTVWREGLL